MRYFKGFTLIELLVVIAVVGVLAGAVIAIINPGAQLGRARDAKRKADIHAIKQALEEYVVINGSYPNTGSVSTWVYSTGGATWIPGLTATYMSVIPKDPINNLAGPWTVASDNYSYAYGSNGLHYNLVARLESKQDPDRCEIKLWFFITGASGTGVAWCPTYSNYIYSITDLNK